MDWIIGLLVIGAVLVFFEAVVPGIVLGLLGAAALFAATVVAFVLYGPFAGIGTGVAALVLVGVVLWLEFKILPKTAFGRRFFHTQVQTAISQPPVAPPDVLGKTAEVVTPLRPGGLVRLDGRDYEAMSLSGFLEPRTPVRVVSIEEFKLTVTRT